MLPSSVTVKENTTITLGHLRQSLTKKTSSTKNDQTITLLRDKKQQDVIADNFRAIFLPAIGPKRLVYKAKMRPITWE